MPIRIRVDLDPAVPGRAESGHSGRSVNAAVLAAIRDTSPPALSQALHSPSGYKPYTVTPVLNGSWPPARQTASPLWFGLGLLTDDLASPVLTALESTKEIRIGSAFYPIAKVTVPMSATYEELAARAGTAVTWEFTLVTPTGFATAAGEGPRREIPWPEPTRAFGNLARRWSYFAPAAPLPEDTKTVVQSHIEVADFDMRMARFPVKPGQPERHGAVGRITYRIAAANTLQPSTVKTLNTLACYAEYAGLGDRTSIGMGYVRSSGRQPA